MFAEAYSKVSEFTHPVLFFLRTYDEEVSTGVGTFTILNEDGWIVTARHII